MNRVKRNFGTGARIPEEPGWIPFHLTGGTDDVISAEEVICMLDFNSILVFSEDPKKLAEFYKKIFQKDPDWEEAGYYGFMAGKGFITFGPHDKVKGKSRNPERIMFNLETKDVTGEFARIKKSGAAVVAEPYNPTEDPKMMIATFADPDNNYFQLVTPWESD
jgi:predicted enzyme related to lactoylglutathione lyase